MKGSEKMNIEEKLDKMIDLLELSNKYLLTVDEACERCSISKTKFREIMNRRTFPKVMNGNRTLIIASELNDWIMSNKGGQI
ncbi:helix-turn-helix domain-containing protein [Ezakiella coagulans]|uniref:helix-turn-helix domain-containing protein n=1 Tax=Ezakiella coagulans TaxID=46507 RepID=UPI00288AE401|nr:helix-turn-helix domain-containing protein [Ezakiella coagulans]